MNKLNHNDYFMSNEIDGEFKIADNSNVKLLLRVKKKSSNTGKDCEKRVHVAGAHFLKFG